MMRTRLQLVEEAQSIIDETITTTELIIAKSPMGRILTTFERLEDAVAWKKTAPSSAILVRQTITEQKLNI